MRFIVTGTPRSGTRYSSKLMAALGLPCTHEKTLRPLANVVDVLRWWQAAETGESSWMAWTVLPLMPGPVPVLHAIRDPWAVIDSLANRNIITYTSENKTEVMCGIRDTIDTYLPGVMAMEGRVDRSATFVVRWNRLIAERFPGRCTFYVDRMDRTMAHGMLDYLGAERTPDEIDAAIAKIPTNVNIGYSLVKMPGISNPDVARWIAGYANSRGICPANVLTREIKNIPDRQGTDELAARMSPHVLAEVNAYAAEHGYQIADAPMEAVA